MPNDTLTDTGALGGVRDAGLVLMGLSHGFICSLIEGLDAAPAGRFAGAPDAWFVRPFDGANHALWTLGHLVWADSCAFDWTGCADAEPIWGDLYALGTDPSDDRDAQPKPGEVVRVYREQRARLVDHLRSMEPDALGARLRGFLADVIPSGAHLASFMGGHEMSHTGEFRGVRRVLGLPRVRA